MGQVIGIDFGTTTTEVSYIKEGMVRSLKLEDGDYYIPTVIFFLTEDEYLIGKKADVLSRNQDYSCAVIRNFKLDLTNKSMKYNIIAKDGSEFAVKPQKAAQLFLNKLLQIVQPKLISIFGEKDGIIDRAVITVPAQFNPAEKEAIKNAILKAAKNSGFNDIKVAAEPTAAAVAYSDYEEIKEGQTILVYDFGGGTFDVSIIKKGKDKFEEIETDGDKALGGNLLTEKIAENLWDDYCDQLEISYLPFDKEEADVYSEDEYGLSREKYFCNRAEIISVAEEMKLEFTDDEDSASEIVEMFDMSGNAVNIELSLSYRDFCKIISKSIDKTIEIAANVISRTNQKIDYFVLAGGSSRIKIIKDKIRQNPVLSQLKWVEDDDSQTLISRGAAILAKSKLCTDEKTRFELGISVREGSDYNVFMPIIKSGESLPCIGKRKFPIDNRESIKISYYEKDVKKFPDARRVYDDGIDLVSELEIETPKNCSAELEVSFSIEKDGTPLINAKIVDESNNVISSKELVIKRDGELW